ncbi:MAG: apolipoprotein N-acyltransferase, partial [Planctomycetaceae bacterium]|nr:apolipoprotein N-acyltransferase [Planctomycetaceae bacterium]
PPSEGLRSDIRHIIDRGQRTDVERKGSLRSVILLSGASLLLMWLSFTPVEFAPAAWIALVPILQLARLKTLPRGTHRVLAGLGFVWAGVTLQWMRLGHPSMYLALAALAFYVGLYVPVFVLLARRLQRLRLPLWLTVPVVWTALEYARAYLLTGFSWYYLGHSQYRWQSLIQIADLTGVYGITFLVAMSSGVLAELVPQGLLKRWHLDVLELPDNANHGPANFRMKAIGAIAVCVLLIISCTYGVSRRLTDEQFTKGPVISLLQGNFAPEVKHDDTTAMERYRTHMLLQQQASTGQPDLIVWPETMFPDILVEVGEGITDDQIIDVISSQGPVGNGVEAAEIIHRWRDDTVDRSLRDMTKAEGCAILVGIPAQRVGLSRIDSFNSAVFIRPDTGILGRYDKIHRVLFGEYVPLKDAFPFLKDLTPFGPGFGLAAGAEYQTFEYNGHRYSPLICYEATVPQFVRRMVNHTDEGGQHCDVLVNLTNDAWFRGSSELDQHLITSLFRCIETRTPMVRAVNGGISSFIDGNGQIREPDSIEVMETKDHMSLSPTFEKLEGMKDPKTGAWRRQFTGVLTGQLPTDPRESLYVRYGDWFAMACSIATVAGALAASMQKVTS